MTDRDAREDGQEDAGVGQLVQLPRYGECERCERFTITKYHDGAWRCPQCHHCAQYPEDCGEEGSA